MKAHDCPLSASTTSIDTSLDGQMIREMAWSGAEEVTLVPLAIERRRAVAGGWKHPRREKAGVDSSLGGIQDYDDDDQKQELPLKKMEFNETTPPPPPSQAHAQIEKHTHTHTSIRIYQKKKNVQSTRRESRNIFTSRFIGPNRCSKSSKRLPSRFVGLFFPL